MKLSKEILNGVIFKGDRLVVGVSGGADSMCLLSLVKEYSENVDFEFIAVHVNHNLRGNESDRDESFVREFCIKNNIKCECVSVRVKEFAEKNGRTIEQAAREMRYDVFSKLKESFKANKILIAHHSGDQAETVLMHIARGSSLKGAGGMRNLASEIVRPLLNFSREEVVEYNKSNKIEYIEDSTNFDVNYTRNFIRHEVLPKLKTIYPSIEQNLCSFAKLCSRDDDFIESILPLNLLKIEENLATISGSIENIHPALSTRLIKKAFEGLGAFADMEEKHIFEVLELLRLKNGSEISLPNKLYAHKEYDNIVIVKGRKAVKKQEQKFTLGETQIKGYGAIYALDITGKQDPEFGDGNHYVDLQKIPFTAVWRTKKDGDIFAKLGSGSKKLSDYFTDKKVPKRLRESIPVLAVENKILVVAGLDIAEAVKLTSETEQIVKIIYQPK